jgi:nitrogen fixation protein FixH
LLLALCLPILADDLTRITVKVTDEAGRPIDRATVRVVFKQGRSKVKFTKITKSWEMKTSQEGIAKIPGLPKGDILIQVMAQYYQTFGETMTIEDDEKTVEIRLKPPQKQYSVHDGKK